MMNTYVISPKVVKIALDNDLSNQFPHLNSQMNWRPLTTNLESFEESPYLYFRITLKARPGAATFAGFATGAPFMLTRDKDVKKRAFFLRHWVRSVSPNDHSNAPLTALPHMAVAFRDDRLLVRVDIDRPLVSADTFKSIPFATWMFQVVQVDAVIQGLPGVRFAFAIERTVTVEERVFVTASGLSLPSKGPKVKQTASQPMVSRPTLPVHPVQNSTTPRPARPLLGQNVIHPAMQQNVTLRPNMAAYNSVTQRAPAASYQPNPYAYASGRQNLQMRQNVAPRPAYMSPHPQLPKPQNRAYGRPMPIQNSAASSADTLRPVMHPYLRLWEDRNLDDPYEPIFVTEDPKYEERVRKPWLVEQGENHAKRFEYDNLSGIPEADYPSYYCDGQTILAKGGEKDVEIVVQRRKRVRTEASENTSDSGEDQATFLEGAEKYDASIIAASDYNSILRTDRNDLSKWLVEDVTQEEEESEEQDEDDEGDGESSE